MNIEKEPATRFLPMADGDVVSVLIDNVPKLGVYVNEGQVIYAKLLHPGSPVRKIVSTDVGVFSEGRGMSVENLYNAKSTFTSHMRSERVRGCLGIFWGNKYDKNPTESFVRYASEGISPPDGSTMYRFTVAGGVLGFYFAGFIGSVLGSGIGMIADSAKRPNK